MGALSDEQVHYIRAGGTVAIYPRVDDADPATDKTRWLHRDHLGWIALLTDEAGAIAEERSFDPHGRARNADWSAASGAVLLGETKRGFTGQEYIDTVGLIHMNGRVYDPEIGRFLSADPFVQFPESTQGFNRYSYVANNPLSAVDPSGFFFGWLADGISSIGNAISDAIGSLANAIGNAVQSLGQAAYSAGKAVVSVAKSAVTHPVIGSVLQIGATAVATYFCGPCAIGVTTAFSATATLAAGGSITDALIAGGISAGMATLSFGVGEALGPVPVGDIGRIIGHGLAKTLAHGVVGGVSSVIRGGKFLTGMAIGAVSNVAAGIAGSLPLQGPAGILARTAVTAAAGGATAEFGGGSLRTARSAARLRIC